MLAYLRSKRRQRNCKVLIGADLRVRVTDFLERETHDVHVKVDARLKLINEECQMIQCDCHTAVSTAQR